MPNYQNYGLLTIFGTKMPALLHTYYDLNKDCDNDHNAQGGGVGEVEMADHDGSPWRLLTFLPPPLHRRNCSQVTF